MKDKYIRVYPIHNSHRVVIEVPQSSGGYKEYPMGYGELASWIREGIAMLDLVLTDAALPRNTHVKVEGVGSVDRFCGDYKYYLVVKGALRGVDYEGVGL